MPDKLNFLIPLDFNPESKSALQYALSIAKDLEATLHLVYIIEDESPLLKLVIDEKQKDMIRRGASDKLDELAGQIVSPTTLDFTTTILQGKIYDKIIEAAQQVKADIIFMGRTDSSDRKKNFTGTNTMHIIKKVDVPVITLRKKPEKPGCSHIILPLDLTKQTIIQASNAVAMAKILGARITAISFLPEGRKSIEIKFIQRLDEIRNIFEKLGIQCDVKLIPDNLKNHFDKLNDTFRELEGDLIMIMTQQELNITDFFIGSYAQDIINKSNSPVMSINPLSGEEEGIPDPMTEVFINPIQILDH
jgi:nucleotide-binding universal stress UspA family protein